MNTLMSEIQRLNTLCAERKEAEDSLRKKWKKIEEFDARRSELESIYSALLKASMVRLNLCPSMRCDMSLHQPSVLTFLFPFLEGGRGGVACDCGLKI